jgi:hypothetical protein
MPATIIAEDRRTRPTEVPADVAALHASLRTLAVQAQGVDRARLGLEAQINKFGEDGWPPAAHLWSQDQLPALRRIRDSLMRQLVRLMKGTPLGDWQQATPALGSSILFLLGLMPHMLEFHSVAAVWKYTGLHVSEDGEAPRRKKGVKLGWSPRLRSYAIIWVALPCTKNRASPYRTVYDRRRAHTAETHPDWPIGHSHADALRITAKAVLRDAWRVARGLRPKYADTLE